MGRRISYLFGISVAALAHLAVIPVMAIYGVHICPVLHELGIGFGVKFNSVFVGSILSVNASLTGLGWIALATIYRKNPARAGVYGYFPFVSMLAHMAAFALGLHYLKIYLRGFNVPEYTLRNLGAAFVYTTVLLSVLQAHIVDWMTQGWLRTNVARAVATPSSAPREGLFGLSARWAYHTIWSGLPFVAVIVIGGTNLYRSLMELVGVENLESKMLENVLMSTGEFFVLLLGWLALVRLFSLLKEKHVVSAVHSHLQALGRLDPNYYSPTVASGYWGNIFTSLNQTTEIICQRARLIKGFSAYVTNTVVKSVLERDDLKPEGELRELTILMTDLRDFTKMSSTLPAEQVVKILNIYFKDMIEVLTENHVTLDKFIGDGILAYVEPGVARPGESAQEVGLRAAIAMHERLILTNRTLSEQGLPQLKLGVAVHSGKVVLGTIGAPERMQHTMIGDPVNVAARLEGLCKRFGVGVIVSEEVFSTVNDALRSAFRDLGPQQIRGLSNAVQVYGIESPALSSSANAA